jgi:hypothetical protein
MAKVRNEEFNKRFVAAKTKLGWHYAAITNLKYPHFSLDQIRSVANRNAENWEILQAMEYLAGILTPDAIEAN